MKLEDALKIIGEPSQCGGAGYMIGFQWSDGRFLTGEPLIESFEKAQALAAQFAYRTAHFSLHIGRGRPVNIRVLHSDFVPVENSIFDRRVEE